MSPNPTKLQPDDVVAILLPAGRSTFAVMGCCDVPRRPAYLLSDGTALTEQPTDIEHVEVLDVPGVLAACAAPGTLASRRAAWVKALNRAVHAAALEPAQDLAYQGALRGLTHGQIGLRWLDHLGRGGRLALHDGPHGLVAVYPTSGAFS